MEFLVPDSACLAMVKKSYRAPLKKAIHFHGRNAGGFKASSEGGERVRARARALGLFLNNLCSTLSPLPTDSYKQRNPNSLTPFA